MAKQPGNHRTGARHISVKITSLSYLEKVSFVLPQIPPMTSTSMLMDVAVNLKITEHMNASPKRWQSLTGQGGPAHPTLLCASRFLFPVSWEGINPEISLARGSIQPCAPLLQTLNYNSCPLSHTQTNTVGTEKKTILKKGKRKASLDISRKLLIDHHRPV